MSDWPDWARVLFSLVLIGYFVLAVFVGLLVARWLYDLYRRHDD